MGSLPEPDWAPPAGVFPNKKRIKSFLSTPEEKQPPPPSMARWGNDGSVIVVVEITTRGNRSRHVLPARESLCHQEEYTFPTLSCLSVLLPCLFPKPGDKTQRTWGWGPGWRRRDGAMTWGYGTVLSGTLLPLSPPHSLSPLCTGWGRGR